MLTFIFSLFLGILIVLADQLSKLWVINNFSLGESREFINGFIEFVYIHNRGGAWGIFFDKTLFLVIFTSIIMIICLTAMFLVRNKSRLLVWSLALVISGGTGNLIDRVFRNGNVIDFLQFDFWKSFPVFNVADIAVVIGVGLLILYYILDSINEFKAKKCDSEKLVENGEI